MTIRITREEKLAVKCPRCGAPPCEPCQNVRNVYLDAEGPLAGFHPARRQAALDAKRARGEATGDCYEAAGRYVTDAAFVGQADSHTLVHGVVSGQGPLEGRRFGHAWVEVDDVVVDASNGRNLVLPRDAYYRLGRVVAEECRRYTPEEATIEMVRSKHWGPWEGESSDE